MGENTGVVPEGQVEAVGAGPVSAVLRISLGPAFPGNVHVYDITIDPRDGTFAGSAHRASNIRGETITGALSAGNTDIDFTAVYPTPAYEYAWFGTGPIVGFTGGDSLGNVMDALSATVTCPAPDRDDTPEVARDAVAEVAPEIEEPVEVAVVVVEPPEVVVAEVAPEIEEPVEVAVVVDETPAAPVTEPETVIEPEIAIEPETVIEPEPVVARADADPTADSPPAEVHAEGCQCLACRWAAYKPIPVTEGPFAGKAFYFGSPDPVAAPDAPVYAAPSMNNHADKALTNTDHSKTRGKRRLVSSPTRR